MIILENIVTNFKIDISEMEEVLEEFEEAAKEYKTILTFLVHIEEVKEEILKNKKNVNEEAVILSTVHSVKGMEFKNVFIINCTEENLLLILIVWMKILKKKEDFSM